MALSLFKLEKLTILAIDATTGSWLDKYTAAFNPATIRQSYSVDWSCRQGINSSGASLLYSKSKPQELSVDLLFEGTGVDEMGVALFRREPVKDQVESFLKTVYEYNGSIHEPHLLNVSWGSLSFDCRLKSVEITFTAFHRDGTPLRAEANVSFIADHDPEHLAKLEGRTSPDLTHSRLVRAGDTLPGLAREIYGTPDPYLAVARFNELDDFRRLVPGHTLLFPPLDQLQ